MNCILLNFKNIGGQLSCWMEELSTYDMDIEHRAGAKHGNADGLSRMPDTVAECGNYKSGVNVMDLPCMPGCTFCTRAEAQWGEFFENVDNVTDLVLPPGENVGSVTVGATDVANAGEGGRLAAMTLAGYRSTRLIKSGNSSWRIKMWRR